MTETIHAETPQTDHSPPRAARRQRSAGSRGDAGGGLVLQRAAARAAGGRHPAPPSLLPTLQRTAGNAAVARSLLAGATLQRCGCGGETADGEECAECREGHAAVQRQAAGPGAADPSAVHEVLRSPGRPLDPPVRADLEGHLRHDFSNVRIHHGGGAAASARMLNARAYTVGSHVVFGDGEFRPGSSSGRALLAHELTHVVQQSSSSTTSSSGGLAVDPDPALEAEARAAEKGVASAPARVARAGASSIQRRIQVAGPDRVPPHLERTRMTAADVAATPPELVGQSAAAVVTRLLNRLCPSGGWAVDSSGIVAGGAGFCGGDAQAAAPQATGCGCLCELTSGGSLSVQLHVTDRSVDTTGTLVDPPIRNRGEGMATTNLGVAAGQRVYQVAISGRNNVSGSVRGRGDTGATADTLGHQALRDPPWLILGHEMCGHVRKDLSQPDKRHFGHTMSEGYDTSAVDVENALRREQSTATDNLGIRFGDFADASGDRHLGLVYRIKFGARVVTLHRKFNIPYEHMMSDPVQDMSRAYFLACNQGQFDPQRPQRVFAHVFSHNTDFGARLIPSVCDQYHFQPGALVYLEGVFAHRTIAGETKTSIAAMWNVSLPLLATANTDISDLHTFGDTQVLPTGKVVVIPYDRAAAGAFFPARADRVIPGPAGPACCDALATPASCTTDPMACPAADWEAAIRGCLQTVRIPATASFGPEILRRTDPEIADDVADIRTRYAALSPSARSVAWFVTEARRACNRRVRELEMEYRFNVVFENRRGHPRWGENPPWPDVIAALEAIPEEHLSRRPGATEPMIFRRLDVHPRSPAGSGVGGETLDARRGEIEVYNTGIGTAPYGRSSSLGIPATSQTIRHEIGHSVEPLVDQAERQRFQEQIVGWRDYSWHWINHPPTPICDPAHAPLQAEACELCTELGLLGAAGACDAAALQAFLAQVATAEQVRGGRTYRRSQNFLTSVVTPNVPSLREFEYARTGFGDYFAEVYTFAVSRPEWLHLVLPAAQTSWLKAQVFNTRRHYDEIIPPVVAQIAMLGNAGIAFQVWAQQQFTRQQLLHVASQVGNFLQMQRLNQRGAA